MIKALKQIICCTQKRVERQEGEEPAAMSQKVDTGLVRLNVNLNQETADALKQLADSQGVSLTEAVRRAIAISKFVADEQSKGRKIQTMNNQGKDKKELVLM